MSSLVRRRQGPTVLFLGAGAGVADGLPSSEEMAQAICDYISYERLHPTFLWFPLFEQFIARRDLESLMSLISYLNEDSSKNHLALYLYHVLAWAAAKSADLPDAGVDGFRRRLIEHFYSHDEPLYVLTTNWDTSLDTILENIVKNDVRGPGLVNYGLELNGAALTELTTAGKTIHYYKLNGSPDWVVCTNCKSLVRVTVADDTEWRPPEMHHLEYNCYCAHCGSLMQRVVVLPSTGRAQNPLALDQYGIDPAGVGLNLVKLLSVQSQAMTALIAAERFIFVGYSLPQYDLAIRSLLETAFRSNFFVAQGRAKVEVIVKEDPSGKVKRNFEALLSPLRVRFSNGGLEGFLQEVERNG